MGRSKVQREIIEANTMGDLMHQNTRRRIRSTNYDAVRELGAQGATSNTNKSEEELRENAGNTQRVNTQSTKYLPFTVRPWHDLRDRYEFYTLRENVQPFGTAASSISVTLSAIERIAPARVSLCT